MRLALPAFLSLLIGCGQQQDIKAPHTLSTVVVTPIPTAIPTDADLAVYVNEFASVCGTATVPITFSTDFDQKFLAVCRTHFDGPKPLYKEILVGKDRWEKLPEGDKWMLIAHEMGHAVLNLGHDWATLMNPFLQPGYSKVKVMKMYKERCGG